MEHNPRKILLVEDNPMDAYLVQEMLKSEGQGRLDVSWTDRLDKAVDWLQQEKCDSILLDMILPDSWGIDTLKRVHSLAPTIPIVVVTGTEDEELAMKAILEGAQDYLVKGTFDGRGIMKAVRYAIERKRAESARSHLVAIVESSEDAVIGSQPDGAITSWNSAAERIFGYPAREIIGLSISLLFPPDHHKEATEAIDRIRKGEHLTNYETMLLRSGGQSIAVSLTLSPIKERGGQVVGFSAIARDITEDKRIREEREQLLEQLTEALSKVKLLSGLLPICANCRKVRDDRGYWDDIENYIRTHSEADFTHGICPACAEKLYPEFGKM